MTEHTHVFSDISCMDGVTAFCVAFWRDGMKSPSYHVGTLKMKANNVAAEIWALAVALRMLEQTGRPLDLITVHSDLDWFPEFMQGFPATRNKLSYSDKIWPKAVELHAVAMRLPRVEWCVVNRRNDFYRECHKRSRAKARLERKLTKGRLTIRRTQKPA